MAPGHFGCAGFFLPRAPSPTGSKAASGLAVRQPGPLPLGLRRETILGLGLNVDQDQILMPKLYCQLCFCKRGLREVPFRFFPGIRIFLENHQTPWGHVDRLLKRTMAEKHGESTPRTRTPAVWGLLQTKPKGTICLRRSLQSHFWV